MEIGARKRKQDLLRFYQLLGQLCEKTGGPFLLANCNGRRSWPLRGVYFFMEEGESRSETGSGLRIVRIGTHALKAESKSTLWQRLRQHKGTKSGEGNHRGSIFRLLVGTTIKGRYPDCSTWGERQASKKDIHIQEKAIEQEVSAIIRRMPFLCLNVDDDASPDSLRGVVERNAIALLSNFQKLHMDAPSANWRGYRCNREKVWQSGLWNQNHVDEDYDPAFLLTMERLIDKAGLII